MLRTFAHLVACCCAFLGVALESGQTFSLRAEEHNNAQHCWANNVGKGVVELQTRPFVRCFKWSGNKREQSSPYPISVFIYP